MCLRYIANWTPLSIAALYKHRCQVELFFKWIKQHLRIKLSGLKTRRGRKQEAKSHQLRVALRAVFAGSA